MSVVSSFRALRTILREDSELTQLGIQRGTLLRMHYRGRLESRLGWESKTRTLDFGHISRNVKLKLSAPYLGAFKGVFLDCEYACQSFLETPPARILDLGANIGMGAISLVCQFPNSQVVCVEPDPRNLALLQENLRINNLNAKIIEAAVGPTSGSLALRFDSDPTCSALETSPLHDHGRRVPVTVTTVSEILAHAGWDTVDLLKVDIEGSEDELLTQNNEWLSQVSAIIFEIHPNTSKQKIASYLAPYGFQLNRVGFGREPVYFAARIRFRRSE